MAVVVVVLLARDHITRLEYALAALEYAPAALEYAPAATAADRVAIHCR